MGYAGLLRAANTFYCVRTDRRRAFSVCCERAFFARAQTEILPVLCAARTASCARSAHRDQVCVCCAHTP
ncbi:hypothetical protein Poly41_29960 [Novipirellula artificiosorum]|uniref:Uncharacterized protein n=1 Tax=Novipirellula artificiosorum TaxID=2528016 RepID=A0A5C6DUR8_9BACT|nr:hypothetical protein Poly41_29960 [Novipirellula artificiosorum]